MIIYVPENIDSVKIENGAGKINIENLNTNEFSLNIGAGETSIEKLNVIEKTKIEGGAGKIKINNANINELEADLGVGEFIFNGVINGKSRIDSGVGSTKLDLTNKMEDYKFKISKGIGNITLNSKELKDNEIYGDGNNYIKIDGGIGKITINTNNDENEKEISIQEAEKIIENKFGTKEEDTGYLIKYGYMSTVKDKEGIKYYAFRQSWLVDDHSSFLQNIFISLDGKIIKTLEEPKFFEEDDIIEF